MKLNRTLYASLVLLCVGFASSAVFAQSSSDFIDVEIGNDITCGLRFDGSLSCPVRHIVPRFELPDDMPPVVNVSVGNDFACAVQSDGFLRCWGDDGHGQLQAPSNGAPYHSVSAGEAHACAINNAGAIECWGLSTNNRLAAPEGTFIEVSVSEQDTCALTINGTVECWGANDSGTASPPDELPAAQQVVAGRSASCALLLDGSVQCWGLDFPIAEGGPFIDIDMTVSGTPDTGPYAEFCGLDVDGRIHCRITYSNNPSSSFQDVLDKIPDTPGYTALAVNGLNICAVNSAASVECWGRQELLPIPGVDSGDFTIDTTTGLRAEIYSDSTVELFWDFPDNIHIAFAGHEILRDGEVFAFTPNASSFIDTELQAGVPVVYTVRRVQVDGSTGDLSEAITVDTANRYSDPGGTGDYQVPDRPHTPTGLTASVYGGKLLELFWDRPDTSELRGYEIHRDGEFLAFTTGVSFLDTVPETNRIYHYGIIPISQTQAEFQGISSVDVQVGDADAGVCR